MTQTITYIGDLSTNLDRVRFHLGDKVEGSGPQPEDGNFSDEELTGLITDEATWQRAVAGGFEILASMWTKHVTFTFGRMEASNQSDIAKMYTAMAADWRKRFGTTQMQVGGSRRVVRQDAFSDNLDNVTR